MKVWWMQVLERHALWLLKNNMSEAALMSAPICFECNYHNYATEVSGLLIEAMIHKSVVFWIETARVGHSGKWKKGHLSSWGSWEIGKHTSIFNTLSHIFFFPMGIISDQVQMFSAHFSSHIWMASPHEGHCEAVWTIPKQGKCWLLFWRGRNASQCFRVWHSACRQLISLLGSG